MAELFCANRIRIRLLVAYHIIRKTAGYLTGGPPNLRFCRVMLFVALDEGLIQELEATFKC